MTASAAIRTDLGQRTLQPPPRRTHAVQLQRLRVIQLRPAKAAVLRIRHQLPERVPFLVPDRPVNGQVVQGKNAHPHQLVDGPLQRFPGLAGGQVQDDAVPGQYPNFPYAASQSKGSQRSGS